MAEDVSVRIVVPPRKSMPKLRPMVMISTTETSTISTENPKVPACQRKKSILVCSGTNFRRNAM